MQALSMYVLRSVQKKMRIFRKITHSPVNHLESVKQSQNTLKFLMEVPQDCTQNNFLAHDSHQSHKGTLIIFICRSRINIKILATHCFSPLNAPPTLSAMISPPHQWIKHTFLTVRPTVCTNIYSRYTANESLARHKFLLVKL